MTIARMYRNYKPFAFFGILSLLLLIVSLLFFLPVLMEYFATGLVPRFPTLIVCMFGLMASLQLFVAGLILATLQERDKRRFEFQLQQVSDQYRHLCALEERREDGKLSSAS